MKNVDVDLVMKFSVGSFPSSSTKTVIVRCDGYKPKQINYLYVHYGWNKVMDRLSAYDSTAVKLGR